jgi:tetratricopeptide (TPR) repeat protein
VAVRAAGAYAFLCTADFDGYEAMLDEVLELADGDRTVGAGVILGSPTGWAVMGKGMVRRERAQFEEAEELFERALRVALDEDDPETASWVRSNQAGLRAVLGDTDGGLAIARRNCELTERLGDVFSRSLALANLAWTELAAERYEDALASIEEAERLYRDAMDNGGEMEGWRAQMRAQALTGVGRAEEAIEVAEAAVRMSGERGMLWTYPIANLALARALSAAGREGAFEALEEGERVAERTKARSLLNDIRAERERLAAGAGKFA